MAMAVILSVSLTRSSRASRMVVRPSARAAATQIAGNSSMARGTTLPEMAIPFKCEERTRMSATGSPESSRWSSSSICPPMSRRISITPVRVGFTPTFRISSSEPGVVSAATMKKAADEISAGTEISWAVSSEPPRTVTPVSLAVILAPKSRNIRSEWSRERLGSRTDVSPSA